MRNKSYFPTMVQAIAVLTVLKMLTNAQTTCNHGLGRVVYERIPDHQLQGFNDDVVKDTMPPFRMLEKCQDLCLRDRTAVNNLVRTCTSFNFQPGVRIASFSGTPEYEESICYLTQEQAAPEGIGNLVLVPNSVHYTEVCLTASRIEDECPKRRYVFERFPRKKLKLLASDHREVRVSNRTDCEERCLMERSFVCRSVTYNGVEQTCSMSRFTRRSHPELLQDDPTSDYLENTCLSAERRCDGLAVFVKEENKRLGGPFEVDMYVNISLEQCQHLCLRAQKYFCRSIEYDERRKECVISEEDSISQKDDLRASGSLTGHLYDLVCLDSNNNRNDYGDNSVTSHLFSDGRRPDTAFQRYRNSRLGGEFHSEITSRTLSECLDECLRQASFQCRSAVYSERFRVCRLSRFNQRDGHRIIYDADYDYYENLMTSEGDGFGPNYRPDPLGQDSSYHSHGRPPYYPNPNPNPYPTPHYVYPGGNYPSNYPNNYPNSYPASYPNYQGNGYQPGYVNYPSNTNYGPGRYGGGAMPGGNYPPDRYGNTPYSPAPPSYPMPGAGSHPPSNYYPYQAGYPPPPGNDVYGPNKFSSRCDEADNFRQVGVRLRIRRSFVRRYVTAPTLPICERECAEARDFICRSFNYRSGATAGYPSVGPDRDRDNCELSDKDSRELDINNPTYFEISGDYDYFERSPGRNGQGECLDVSQQCSEDGMEFALKTPEGFFGRIYTYGFYDRCFFRGNGGTINVLRISGAQGYPECGTQRYGDTMTNIVVVQFSDFVQTGRDKRYNLTCLFRGPGEAVVTSGYIGAGSGSPIPIEYLPAENSLSSKVRLMILYQNRPTTTIAVGDPLTFRLEAQDNYNYPSDIFATNVIARDPYSGRSVQLIDRFGCPVDNYVFPGLDRSREGDGLEARFNAFKIPESNFLVFEATVKTCRDGCQPAYCTGQTGRSEPSFGRRRRDVSNETDTTSSTTTTTTTTTTTEAQTTASSTSDTTTTTVKRNLATSTRAPVKRLVPASTTIRISTDQVINGKTRRPEMPKVVGGIKPVEIRDEKTEKALEEEEFVREMIKVLDTRYDILNEDTPEVSAQLTQTTCLASTEYYGLISALIIILCILLIFAALAGVIYRRYWLLGLKNREASNASPFGSLPKRPFSFLSPPRGAKIEETTLSHVSGSRNNLCAENQWTSVGSFTKNFGKQSLTKKMFESLFNREEIRPNENFTLSRSGKFDDPSEPIYTDPSLFEVERSRSLRSIAMSAKDQKNYS